MLHDVKLVGHVKVDRQLASINHILNENEYYNVNGQPLRQKTFLKIHSKKQVEEIPIPDLSESAKVVGSSYSFDALMMTKPIQIRPDGTRIFSRVRYNNRSIKN